MEVRSPPTLLPIDECEEWIWDILGSNKDSGFEYLVDEDKEFLILNTNDFHASPTALYKIRRLTGMRLAQMSTHNCYTQLWFYRPSNLVGKT
ncbi:MAG TPA: hypothetical protein VFS97_06960 [Nitrososphaeraceae archaeon]|nr:hypothetical protein [Nitrososphaeraceae archaeon]